MGAVTVAKAYRLLRAVLNTAVEDGVIRRNPCQIKGAGAEAIPERPVASVAQVLAIVDAMPPRYRAFFLLATFGSLRWGEVVALRRRHVDLDTARVRVEASVGVAGRLRHTRPQTDAGVRTVTIPAAVVPMLTWHMQRFAEPGLDGRVIVGPKGATPRRAHFNKIWKQALAEAHITAPLHVHDLRHTGNTLAAATGASLRELMSRMGHASSRAALIYHHATEDRDRAIAAALSDLVEAAEIKRAERENGGDSGTSVARDA